MLFVCTSWLELFWFWCVNSVDFFVVLFIEVFYFVDNLGLLSLLFDC